MCISRDKCLSRDALAEGLVLNSENRETDRSITSLFVLLT